MDAQENSEGAGGEQQFEIDEDAFKRDIGLVSKIEEYCCSGEFTTFLAEFQQTHAEKFVDGEDQPIECFQIHQEYKKLLGAKVDGFCQQENIAIDDMFQALQRVHSVDPDCLFSLNFLLAQEDYNNFVDMMLDYKHAFMWKEGDGEKKE